MLSLCERLCLALDSGGDAAVVRARDAEHAQVDGQGRDEQDGREPCLKHRSLGYSADLMISALEL
jgi:hypothetical protein